MLNIDKAAYAAEIIRCQETSRSPLHSHSLVAQSLMSAHVQSKGCRVLFGGEGADEYFGGYDAYQQDINGSGNTSPSPYLSYDTPQISFIDDDPSSLERDLVNAWKEAQHAYLSVPELQDRIRPRYDVRRCCLSASCCWIAFFRSYVDEQ